MVAMTNYGVLKFWAFRSHAAAGRLTMPDLHLLPTFVLATAVLMLIPGPNVALIVANSIAYGARWGVLTVLATSTASMLQLALVALGMAELVGHLGDWFEWVRWAGVAYLVVLGIQQWRAVPADLEHVRPQPRSLGRIFGRAVAVSLTNPEDAAVLWGVLPAIHHARRPARAAIAGVGGRFIC